MVLALVVIFFLVFIFEGIQALIPVGFDEQFQQLPDEGFSLFHVLDYISHPIWGTIHSMPVGTEPKMCFFIGVVVFVVAVDVLYQRVDVSVCHLHIKGEVLICVGVLAEGKLQRVFSVFPFFDRYRPSIGFGYLRDSVYQFLMFHILGGLCYFFLVCGTNLSVYFRHYELSLFFGNFHILILICLLVEDGDFNIHI